MGRAVGVLRVQRRGGNFLARIPQFKEDLELDDAQLGLALLGSPVGALVVQLVGTAAGRWGSKRVARVSVIGGCLALFLPAFAEPSLAVCWLVGGAYGVHHVAANAQAFAIQQQLRRPIMNGLHGGYSLGGLFGALVGSGRGGPGDHSQGASVGDGGRARGRGVGRVRARCWASRTIRTCTRRRSRGRGEPDEATQERVDHGRVRLLAGYRAVVLARADRAALVRRRGRGRRLDGCICAKTLDSSAGVAGLGFAGMSVAWPAGRFAGDRVVERFGPVRVLRIGALIGALGMTLALATPWAAVSVLGFTLFGVGGGPGRPGDVQRGRQHPGGARRVGHLAGDRHRLHRAARGATDDRLIAHHTSLTTALAIPAVLVAIIALTAGAVAS